MKDMYIIVAMTKNRVIGKNNKMPWHISDDLKLFKRLTQGNIVIMGRKTYESIGKPLPDRENLVISSKPDSLEGCRVFSNILDAVRYAQSSDKKIFFMGGAKLYQQAAGIVNHMYVSWVKKEYDGDTFFPETDFSKWQKVETEEYEDFTMNHYARL